MNEKTISLWNKLLTTKKSVEAGSNTSTVTLRIIGGYEKGSLRSEAVKYGRIQERLRSLRPAEYTKHGPVLSSERAPPKKQDRNCQRLINI
jgi:hypothetical protein